MSDRKKKWVVIVHPTLRPRTVWSKKRALELAAYYFEDFVLDVTRVTGVTIKVDMRDGKGLQRFEVQNFRRREDGSAYIETWKGQV